MGHTWNGKMRATEFQHIEICQLQVKEVEEGVKNLERVHSRRHVEDEFEKGRCTRLWFVEKWYFGGNTDVKTLMMMISVATHLCIIKTNYSLNRLFIYNVNCTHMRTKVPSHNNTNQQVQTALTSHSRSSYE